MREFMAKVWLPDDTRFCDQYENCVFRAGGYCLLLQDTLANDGNYYVKLDDCPAYQKDEE